MSLLKAYMSKPSTQRVLKRKPGDKGFSLIELVVVVAVLAILAAIAVPAFMGMSEEAANAAAQSNLKGAYKECAYKIARGETPQTYTEPTDDGYFEYSTNATGGGATNLCSLTLTATPVGSHTGAGGTESITINLTTGAKSGSVTGITW